MCMHMSAIAQTKKDGTPDMRYRVNKELYGNGFSTQSYSNPSYPEPVYSSPSYSDPIPFRNYDNGGQLKFQNGYLRGNGIYVMPHLKTTPDNYQWNNKNSWPPR